jgi:hypothetical protein
MRELAVDDTATSSSSSKGSIRWALNNAYAQAMEKVEYSNRV